jgi:UDP-N-acetylglucosamine transferase subunit ALG13
MRILVTVGSLPYPMDRLVGSMDTWSGGHPDHEVIMQIGYSTYRPVHAAEWFDFAPFAVFQDRFHTSDVVVAHGSAGPILTARRLGLPLVLVPRQERYGECYNDHQCEVCEAIRGESAMREIVLQIEDLGPALDRAIAKRRDGRGYQTHSLKQRLVDTLAAFAENVARD